MRAENEWFHNQEKFENLCQWTSDEAKPDSFEYSLRYAVVCNIKFSFYTLFVF